MKKNISILSTKKLSKTQCDLFAKHNIEIEHYNAITITKFPITITNAIDNVICSSQHAAQLIMDQHAVIKNVFCVGEKTASIFIKNGYNVVESAKNASTLAEIIVKKYKNDSFLFFCGNRRRSELPTILFSNQINFEEQICYETNLVSRKNEQNFDGILFFSPSAVQSYMLTNNLSESAFFCIGNTTANELKNHSQNVIVSSDTTVENVISTAIHYFRS